MMSEDKIIISESYSVFIKTEETEFGNIRLILQEESKEHICIITKEEALLLVNTIKTILRNESHLEITERVR
jgi:hypothetical protein